MEQRQHPDFARGEALYEPLRAMLEKEHPGCVVYFEVAAGDYAVGKTGDAACEAYLASHGPASFPPGGRMFIGFTIKEKPPAKHAAETLEQCEWFARMRSKKR